MDHYHSFLDWIDGQKKDMYSLLCNWAHINSGSENLQGITAMSNALKASFSVLDGSMQEHSLKHWKKINSKGNEVSIPLARALSIRKRPKAPVQVFLNAHLDTVYPIDSPFQDCKLLDNNTLNGPGVADLKGGIVIMLKALEAFEQSPFSKNLGWEILFNPDEEIGSPGSAPLLRDCAKRHHLGLIFEPSLPDGTLINQRKGSAIYTLISKGKSAHVGREFTKGDNAIVKLAAFVQELHQLNSPKIILNIGKIEGGGPVNIVPDIAICRFNVRVDSEKDLEEVLSRITTLLKGFNKHSKDALVLHRECTRPPKIYDQKTQNLFEAMRDCGKDLNLKLSWKSSGGVCDGNILASMGLPTIDTLGVRGGAIHTFDEYVLLDSLTERARLVSLFLMKLSNKDIKLIEENSHDSITC